MRQCANAYFEAEALLAYVPIRMRTISQFPDVLFSKVLSSSDPMTTFTYKPKF